MVLGRILIASDRSRAADSLVPCAAGLKRLGAGQALLVNTLCMRHYRDMRQVVEPLVEPRIRAQAEMLERVGFDVSTEVLPGQACEEILPAAERSGAKGIVMATRSGLLVHDLLGGSTVLRVLGRAGKPALVLQARQEDPHWTCCRQTGAWIGDHVLHPTDFSDTAERAFELVRRLPAAGASRLTLLHVQRPGARGAVRREEADRLDAARLSRLAGGGATRGGRAHGGAPARGRSGRRDPACYRGTGRDSDRDGNAGPRAGAGSAAAGQHEPPWAGARASSRKGAEPTAVRAGERSQL